MICPADSLQSLEYLQSFRKKIIDNRIPINCSIDLTCRCNLNCVHCYIKEEDNSSESKKELSTEEVCRILDEAAETGSLYLLFTGGEPLLRNDFADIYRYAKKKGFFVTVFTNGTLISNDILELFEELPPLSVEVSVYGASAGTYGKITGFPEKHKDCMNNIEAMLERNINVRIKTILMTLNRHEFDDIKALAAKHDVRFHFDAAIFPRLNGDHTPLEFRIPPDEAIDMEFSSEEDAERWIDAVKEGGMGAESDKLYLCGAGATGMHITADGWLRPCMMVADIQYNLRNGSISAGWKNISKRVENALAPAELACRKCDKKNICGYCPGTILLETGSYCRKPEFSCIMGAERFKRLITNRELRELYEGKNPEYAETAV